MNNLLEAGRCIFMASSIWLLVVAIRMIAFLVFFVIVVGAWVFSCWLFEIAAAQ